MVLTDNQRIIIRAWLGDVSLDDIMAFIEADTETRVATLRAYAEQRALRVEQTQAELEAASEKAQAEAAAVQEMLS